MCENGVLHTRRQTIGRVESGDFGVGSGGCGYPQGWCGGDFGGWYTKGVNNYK